MSRSRLLVYPVLWLIMESKQSNHQCRAVFANILRQFRDFDPLGIWDPHLVRNLGGASLLCLMQWDASTYVFQIPLMWRMVQQLCILLEPTIIKSSRHYEEHDEVKNDQTKLITNMSQACCLYLKWHPFRPSSRISLDSKDNLRICYHHIWQTSKPSPSISVNLAAKGQAKTTRAEMTPGISCPSSCEIMVYCILWILLYRSSFLVLILVLYLRLSKAYTPDIRKPCRTSQ